MEQPHSKAVFLYKQVRRALRSGRYMPGQRIDPAVLSIEFGVSVTPVRAALHRLIGEGLIIDHSRNGLQVPLPTEVRMRDLYAWMQHLLILSIERGDAKPASRRRSHPFSTDDDSPKQTWKLFDEIARNTGQWSLHQAVRQTNDRLAPIRRAKQELIEHASEELAELQSLWQARDAAGLDHALRAYHLRRTHLVPSIVALLAERSHRSH